MNFINYYSDSLEPRVSTINSSQESRSSKAQLSLANKKSLILGSEDVEIEASTSTLAVDECGDAPRSSEQSQNPIIILKRPQYYTIPSIEMLETLKDDDGKCYIKGFTVGRVGYGNVCFPETMEVSNLNLDDIIHIRHREVILYPDDSKKPPVGQGLNRHAQVTLDGVYPVVSGETIKNPDATLVMYFTENLREVCERKGMRFLEYRPDTGSFVFEVDHFSKYGLDNEDINVDTNKYKNKIDEKTKRITEKDKNGLLSEIDGISTENGYVDDDIMNGLGGISVPDIEMTDIITSSSESKEQSECDRILPDTAICDDYVSSLNSIFDFSSNNYFDRTKEAHLIKSALYFDNFTEIEKGLNATTESIHLITPSSKHVDRIFTIPQRRSVVDLSELQPEIFEVKAFYGKNK